MSSGSVFLNNLDDFIAPSQACVNPLVASKLTGDTSSNLQKSSHSSIGSKVTLSTDFSVSDFSENVISSSTNLSIHSSSIVRPDLIKSRLSTKQGIAEGSPQSISVATVSLNDCLACSGCVTSAEAVLITEQSIDKLMSMLSSKRSNAENSLVIAVQISPNSTASLAQRLDIPPIELLSQLSVILKNQGVDYVLDSSTGADIALVEMKEEFMYRMGRDERSKEWKAPKTTTAISSNSFAVYNQDASLPSANPLVVEQSTIELNTLLPLLSSHCPGWVCYAEKTAPQSLPYLSTVKSSQQILAALVKSKLFTSQKLFMVSIQPCFDKKLEASRKDFYSSAKDETEVDLVLSTAELLNLLLSFAQGVSTLDGASLSDSASKVPLSYEQLRDFIRSAKLNNSSVESGVDSIFSHASATGAAIFSASEQNAGSGAVAEYLFRAYAEEIFGANLWGCELAYQVGRNPDFAEIDLFTVLTAKGLTTSPLPYKIGRNIKIARAYGFRSIQSLILKLKRGTCDLDLVEVMACPSGCNNGGGQLKGQGDGVRGEAPSETKERIAAVEHIFHSSVQFRRPEESPLVKYVYESIGKPLSEPIRNLFHTRYHSIPKLESIAPLAAKW